MSLRYIARDVRLVLLTIRYSVTALDTSLDPNVTIAKFKAYRWTPLKIAFVACNVVMAAFWVIMIPSTFLKILIPTAYITALLLPITSQFVLPASPIFLWLITYFTSRVLPVEWRPRISVTLLATLESVLFGANISDILTRFTHPILDIIAWLPYGVVHFVGPFVVAIFIWLFRQSTALKYWGFAFGYLNLLGVITQILVPCAPPWYEIIYGSVPANYGMLGSPGGLARIDKIFGTKGYTGTFSTSPIIFGAFPSLHAGCSTMEALFIGHFFPKFTFAAWIYVGTLWWATMYLTHHYLIDVTVGACLAVIVFFLTMPSAVKGSGSTERSEAFIAARRSMGLTAGSRTSKYDQYDLERRANHTTIRALSADSSSSRNSLDAGPLPLSSIRSPNPDPNAGPAAGMSSGPGGVASFHAQQQARSHKHTASIASLIHANDRVEEGWSPVVSDFATAEKIRGTNPAR